MRWAGWLLLLLALGGCQQQAGQHDQVWLNGRIEGEHILASTRQPGQVVRLHVREGDRVRAGQLLAELDDAALRAHVTQAGAALHAAQKQYEAALVALEMLKKTLPLQVETARAGLTHARASAEAARAVLAQARRDYQRLKVLFDKGQISREKLENARLALQTARAQARTAEAAVTRADKQLAEAQVALNQIRTKQAEVEALHAQTLRARAALDEATALLAQLKIRAPQAGTVVEKLAHVGEVLAPGAVLFDLVDLDQLYFQGYVPETQLARVRLGQKAEIKVDGVSTPVRGTVRYLSSQAEFTPKEIQTRDERVRQVFAIRIYLDANTQERYKPGMPADARLLSTP